jgi:hypothetical protein
MEKNNRVNVLRYTLTRDQIGTFVAGLHEMQADMIEEVVRNKELKGFPEANKIINYIRSLK